MNTPICDFVSEYSKKDTLRLHMPGHKGNGFLGVETLDITEINGADSLFEASSVILNSELNCSGLFGCDTYYSTEGSSLCIRAMLYLVTLYAKKLGRAPLVLAARNVHKTFVSAVSLCDIDVEWLYAHNTSYLSCDIDAIALDKKLTDMQTKPVALYVTSPDYLGNMIDIRSIASVCHKHDVLLLVDNAHGAYLKFLKTSHHAIDMGADMCCDSAHKTLPVLTGGAYLHISKNADSFFKEKAKTALALFASTSPSYLILQSLDYCNKYIEDSMKRYLPSFVTMVDECKHTLATHGYSLIGDEPLKITINTKEYGYTGEDFAQILRTKNIECEFCDPDFVVLMLSLDTKAEGIEQLKNAMLSIEKRAAITQKPPHLVIPQKVMDIRKAVFSHSKRVNVKNSVNETLAGITLSCPPAVPILVCGEKISHNALALFEYYGIDMVDIVIE